MQAFISYQATDRAVASRIQTLLAALDVTGFLAHEDIQVSEEWRLELMKNLRTADVFVAVLSARYFQSPWCVQEAGIAAFRQIPIVPLSIDGTIPLAFISHIQSTKIDPDNPQLDPLLKGIAKADVHFLLRVLIAQLAASRGYRNAEANFRAFLPYLDRASDEEKTAILQAAADNSQISEASLCASEYLPPLIASHGDRLDKGVLAKLKDTVKRNSV